MSNAPLFPRADFGLPEGIAHVCAGGEPPFLLRHAHAFAAYARDKGEGLPGRTKQEAEVERVRASLARRWSCETGDIGLVSSVAEGVSMLAESIDWRSGDNVLFEPDEYPSVVAPFMAGGRAEIRFKDSANLADLVDARTRVIGASAASYLNGARPDLHLLRKLADSVGAWLVVDYTQAAGWLPIDARIADFAFAASYKWQLGTTGIATAFWNRERQPGWVPSSAGWNSIAPGPGRLDYNAGIPLVADAMRFCRGNPAHLPLYVLGSALDYLDQWETPAVQRHVQALTVALLERLEAAGIPTITPRDPAAHGASVCVATPDANAMVVAMGEKGVLAWGGRGRIRFSFHGYNAMDDVSRIMDALVPAWG
ncbi:aminotransferase class V-fold PLP-dependent enzyme [Plastoroseomonas arctica]|uniref:Aminotransferase class V-fold PLP-dependent enzyme n=1 Tax=Plastoroseomonas arctica TaxID=1509237 RepID=A0AAF1JXA9_9PROT|nr:aminotransferase class V-fold PLP-dependent enzyme [Plastoroseomonas arctica]MBR0656032.1 aminotransferase class V-fold PLP-dependent enzyme [Plastoroseomonas arctica]